MSYVAGLLHILQAVLLLAALPVIAMMFLGSLWEGGDTELKQRIVDWGLLAGPATVAGIGLFAATAVTVLRRRPGQRPLALASAILLAVLAAGWAWTLPGQPGLGPVHTRAVGTAHPSRPGGLRHRHRRRTTVLNRAVL